MQDTTPTGSSDATRSNGGNPEQLPSPVSATPADVVDGGQITLGNEPVSWKEKHETETAKALTFTLVGIMAGTLVLHYVSVIVLMIKGHKDAVDILSHVFDSWLPVISGFVGGAVTFYLTRNKE